MGEVFLDEDNTLGRKVAIKMLSERLDGNSEARERLINEAKAAAALDHPNICSIHEVGEEDGRVDARQGAVEATRVSCHS